MFYNGRFYHSVYQAFSQLSTVSLKLAFLYIFLETAKHSDAVLLEKHLNGPDSSLAEDEVFSLSDEKKMDKNTGGKASKIPVNNPPFKNSSEIIAHSHIEPIYFLTVQGTFKLNSLTLSEKFPRNRIDDFRKYTNKSLIASQMQFFQCKTRGNFFDGVMFGNSISIQSVDRQIIWMCVATHFSLISKCTKSSTCLNLCTARFEVSNKVRSLINDKVLIARKVECYGIILAMSGICHLRWPQ